MLAAAMAIVVAVLLLDPGDDGKLDVLAEARAALPDQDEIVHLETVTTSTLVDASPEAQARFEEFASHHQDDYAPRHFEQWSTAGRWRVASDSRTLDRKWFDGPPNAAPFRINADDLDRIGLIDRVTGPMQEAFDGKTITLYIQQLDAALVFRAPDVSTRSGVTFPGGFFLGSPTLLGSDPVTYLRDALDRGNLSDAGPGEVDGREVRRLVDDSGIIEYDVDAETFAPVRVRMFGRWAGEADSDQPLEKMAEDVSFEVYETMPVDEETAKLLEIEPDSPPTVVEASGAEAVGAP
jgi:hypothetical protein